MQSSQADDGIIWSSLHNFWALFAWIHAETWFNFLILSFAWIHTVFCGPTKTADCNLYYFLLLNIFHWSRYAQFFFTYHFCLTGKSFFKRMLRNFEGCFKWCQPNVCCGGVTKQPQTRVICFFVCQTCFFWKALSIFENGEVRESMCDMKFLHLL